jgi:hypothetical protein
LGPPIKLPFERFKNKFNNLTLWEFKGNIYIKNKIIRLKKLANLYLEENSMQQITAEIQKKFVVFSILSILFYGKAFSDPCSVDQILKDDKITEDELARCPLEPLAESISFNIFKKTLPRGDFYSFNEGLKKVRKNFIFVHFISPSILNIVLNKPPQEAGRALNFLEIPESPQAPGGPQVLASHQNKEPRVNAEIKMTKLSYLPNPLERGRTRNLIPLFPKYARVINCKREFYIRLNFGDIGLVLSPKMFNKMSITWSGNLKIGKNSAPLMNMINLMNNNQFFNIYESEIWGNFNYKNDIVAVLVPSKAEGGGNYLSTIKEPLTLNFIQNFQRRRKLIYYDIVKLPFPEKFGDYEYDRKATFNFGLSNLPTNINICDSIYQY